MRCLWLTLTDPEPRHNGELIYSGGLIDAVSAAGARIDVLASARQGSPREYGQVDGDVCWWVIDHPPRPAWSSIGSLLPHLAHRAASPAKARKLDELLSGRHWDGIVFDGISSGWALGQVRRHFRRTTLKPRMVYISHNHEASLRRQIASIQTNPAMRLVRHWEAAKVEWLENALFDAVDVVTAITPYDRALYLDSYPGKRVDVLTPGYGGRLQASRSITGSMPRRAIIVGSYDWIAKRINLEEFVKAADPLFAAAGAQLDVVGSADEAFLAQWRNRVKATRFTGKVKGVDPYMEQARVAIVPEQHGGGFKLKVLDYVFNRMPILAIDGSVAGVPLRHEDSIMLYSSYEDLARGVLKLIDDLERLNRLHDRAFEECHDKFDWQSRGQLLLSALAA
ncbi:MAG: glycosyltransferase [Alphaproteobacteria bacterium]|nr:glycosyltransferase [Alphaproteobacteria bacterium]